jgi:hypothetical protein
VQAGGRRSRMEGLLATKKSERKSEKSEKNSPKLLMDHRGGRGPANTTQGMKKKPKLSDSPLQRCSSVEGGGEKAKKAKKSGKDSPKLLMDHRVGWGPANTTQTMRKKAKLGDSPSQRCGCMEGGRGAATLSPFFAY